jgi:putative nucleotidyltransferase with HDIG domain
MSVTKTALRATLTAAFGEILDRIRNQDLRRRTVDVWIMAAVEGRWTPETLDGLPFTLLTDAHGVSLLTHSRVAALGAGALLQAMRESYKVMPFAVDEDFLYVGALLHDVGKLIEIEFANETYRMSDRGRCTRHALAGAILAARAGLPDEIVNIIACMENPNAPQRVECILIRQADFATYNSLDHFNRGLLILN